MRTFEKWDELSNKKCTVLLEHVLFDEQQYECDMLQIINDEHRIGVIIKKRELFINKQNVKNFVVHANVYMVNDDMMTITIVNKM